MARLLDEGMDAGLCGFSIQRLGNDSAQADFDGSPMVTDTMCDEDILNLARVLARPRRRLHGNHAGHRRRPRRPRASSRACRRPRSARSSSRPSSRPARIPKSIAAACAGSSACRAKGLPIFGQAATVRSGFAFTLEHWNLYDASPAWRALTTGTKEEKLAKMKDPELRKAVIQRDRRGRPRLRGASGRRRRRAQASDRAVGRESRRTRKVRRQVARPDRRRRGQASGRSDARSRRSRPI